MCHSEMNLVKYHAQIQMSSNGSRLLRLQTGNLRYVFSLRHRK